MTAPGQVLTRTALCWGCAPHAELFALAAAGARHGFPELSVTPGQYLRAGLPDAEIRNRLDDHAVTVGVIDALMTVLPGSPKPEAVAPQWREPFEYSLADCLAAAVGLGARTLNIAHFLGTPAPLPQMALAVRAVADAAADVGLLVTLEFIPGTGIPDLAAAAQIAALTQRPNVGIMFDTWHFQRSGGVLADLDELQPIQVLEAQISDRIEPAPGTPYVPMTGRLAPGEGASPLLDIVQALRRGYPDLVLGVEVFTDDRGDPDDIVAGLAAATRTWLERL
jgi:sugar phosphate isomerase/epimerase